MMPLWIRPRFSRIDTVKESQMELPRIRPMPRDLSPTWQDDVEDLERAKEIVADPSVRARLPQVFHVGPTRTATTWTWYVLKNRANVSQEYKEIFFFAQNFSRGFDWYLSHFAPPLQDLPRVDIEPEYFPGRAARHRIESLIPNARIICSLRDPVDRLFSFYKILIRSTSLPPCSFEEACESDWRLAESARYGTHLEGWLNAFGRDRVLVLFYDDLLANPQAYADTICRFIGIQPFELSNELRQRVYASEHFTKPASRWWGEVGKAVGLRIWEFGSPRLNHLVRRLKLSRLFYDTGAPFTPPDAAVVARIKNRLRPEIELVEHLTGRHLSSWKGANIAPRTETRPALVEYGQNASS